MGNYGYCMFSTTSVSQGGSDKFRVHMVKVTFCRYIVHSDIQELCRSSRIVNNSLLLKFTGVRWDASSFNSLAAVSLTTVQHWRV